MHLHIHKWTNIHTHTSPDRQYQHKKDECPCGAIRHKLKRYNKREVVKIIPPKIEKK